MGWEVKGSDVAMRMGIPCWDLWWCGTHAASRAVAQRCAGSWRV